MDFSTLTHKYATALFNAGKIDDTYRSAVALTGFFSQNKDALYILRALNDKQYIDFINKIPDTNDIIKAWLIIIRKNNRIEQIPLMLQCFLDIADKANNILSLELRTGVPISDSLREEICRIIGTRINRDVSVTAVTDPKIMGGFIAHGKSLLIDATFYGSLKRLYASILHSLHLEEV